MLDALQDGESNQTNYKKVALIKFGMSGAAGVRISMSLGRKDLRIIKH
jgi:hypothetical protein